MSTVKTKMQRLIGVMLLGSALLAGCGGSTSQSTGGDNAGSSSDASTAQPTRAGLPTMPAARFAAPTTMITPQSAQPAVEATATLTATEEMSATEEITATEEVTATEEMTDTE